MRMTEEQLNKAYFECYTEMKQRHSNAELGLGNGKNIAIAKLPNGKYIIRDGQKHIVSYKMPNDDIYYVMGSKHIITNELPEKFFIHELVPSRPLLPGYELHEDYKNGTQEALEIEHTLTKLSDDQIAYIKQEFIDKHFIQDSYQNLINNGYLYKLEIDEKLAKHIVYTESTRQLRFEFYTASGEYIHGYTAPYCHYSPEHPTVIFTNSIVRLLNSSASALNYIERYIDKQSIVHRSILQGNAKSAFANALSNMTNDQINDFIQQMQNINK